MKRLISLTIVILIFLAVSAYAVIRTPVPTTLNTSTYTAIVIPETSGKCRPIAAWSEDQTAWYMAVDAAGTGAVLIPAPGTYSNDCVNDPAGIMFYAKAVSGTPVLSISFGVNP